MLDVRRPRLRPPRLRPARHAPRDHGLAPDAARPSATSSTKNSPASKSCTRSIRVRGLYKETEELRSGFQAAALAGEGPELVYGPSDVLDTFHTMGLLQDMAPWFTDEQRADFVEGALTYLPALVDPTKHELVQVGDRFGNHLALVYNRRFIAEPPKTTDELIALAQSQHDRRRRRRPQGPLRPGVEFHRAVLRDSVSHRLRRLGVRRAADRHAPHARPVPALDTPESVAAYRFMQSLRDEHRVVPGNCDYELADSLFKTGRAAMIINGDWSWADYLDESGHRRRGRRAADRQLDRPADAADDHAQGLLAQRQRDARSGRPPRWRSSSYMTSDDVQRRIVERAADDPRAAIGLRRAARLDRSDATASRRPSSRTRG